MNFIITNQCNKHCPYCFAAPFRNTKEEMSFGDFLIMLDKTENLPVKLLGGEPTLHPDFKKMVNEITKRGLHFTIISNFLFSQDICDFIVNSMPPAQPHFLINATDLDQQNRVETFARNYNAIYQKLYQLDTEEVMSVGYTIQTDKPKNYYLRYTDFLRKHLVSIEHLRLSLNFPGFQKGKNQFYFIHNKEFGGIFLELVQKCLSHGIKPSIDCTIYPCMFKNKEEWKYLCKFTTLHKVSCRNAPADIFPDKTLSYCYPLKDVIKIDSRKHANFNNAVEELLLRYRALISKVQLPPPCQECGFRKNEICEGPCLGFYDLSSETIGRNL